MSSVKDIKQRIANVSSVEQIVKAMDMVASTKLIKARKQLDGVRPLYTELKQMTEGLGNQIDRDKNKYYREREVKSSLYIIFTSDKGLSGSYNSNIQTKALEHMQGKNEKIVVVGSKGNEYFTKKEKNIVRKIVDVADAKVYCGTENLAKWLVDYYLADEVQEVFIAYTDFENILTYIPVVERILPIVPEGTEGSDNIGDMKYEQDIDTFINHVMPLYLHMILFRALSESHTSEQAARMINMDAAGKNASDIIEDLNRMYNRKRQAAITQELSEIVGSANILSEGGNR